VDVPKRIEVEDGSRVLLTWEDDATTTLSAPQLRGACQCAGCREPEGAAQTRAVLSGTVPVTIAETSLVGGYALRFVFVPDGHGTGIYSFDALRALGEADQPPG
jgi:DUF971 family protein